MYLPLKGRITISQIRKNVKPPRCIGDCFYFSLILAVKRQKIVRVSTPSSQNPGISQQPIRRTHSSKSPAERSIGSRAARQSPELLRLFQKNQELHWLIHAQRHPPTNAPGFVVHDTRQVSGSLCPEQCWRRSSFASVHVAHAHQDPCSTTDRPLPSE